LRHLALGIHVSAIDSEADGSNEKDAHGQRSQDDRLAVFIFDSHDDSHEEAPQYVMIP
jgi:hypothetical protein